MAVDAPFPSLGDDPWGGTIIPWAEQVRENVNELDQIVNEGRLSPDQLSATIGEIVAAAGGGAGGTVPGLSDVVAGYLDFGTVGSLTLMGVADSTLNDGGDGQRKVLRLLMAETPVGVGIREHLNTGGSAPTYSAPIVLRAGDGSDGSGGIVFSDDLNRVVGELFGSVSSGGQTWDGVAGSWAADGSHAYALVGSTGALSFDTGSQNMTCTATVDLITTAPASQRLFRVYAGASSANPPGGGSYLWAQLRVSQAGTVDLQLWKRISGTQTQIGATLALTGIDTNSATPITIEVEATLNGLDATAVARVPGQADQTVTGTLDAGDLAVLGTRGGFAGVNTGTEITVDAVEMSTPVVPGTWRGIEWYNAAVSGQNLAYHLAHIDDLAPASLHIDAVVIADGHNEGTLPVADYLTALDAYLAAFQERHPETAIMLASENPRFAPADTINEHAARQRALRAYAARNGYEYLPVFEAYANQADGGASLVQSDGIHPTASGTTDTTTWCGQLLWARLVMNAVQARRTVGVKPPITA